MSQATLTPAEQLRADLPRNDAQYYDSAHQAFKEWLVPLLHEQPLGVLVVDFTVGA